MYKKDEKNNKSSKKGQYNAEYASNDLQASQKPLNPGMVNEYDEFAKELNPDDFE